MTSPACDQLPTPIEWPATIDRTGLDAGVLAVSGLAIETGGICDGAIIEKATVSIDVTVETGNGSAIDYQIQTSLGGTSSQHVWVDQLGGNVNLAGQLSANGTGTAVFEVGALAGGDPAALPTLSFGLTTRPGSVVTFGQPTVDLELNTALCAPPAPGDPVTGIVKLCLETQTVQDCAGDTYSLEALPTVVAGVVNVRVCPEVTLDWVPVFQCVVGDYPGVGVGGRDILDGDTIIANLLTDSATGGVVNVVYVDAQDPTFTLPEDIVVGECAETPVVTPRGCVRDTDGTKWDVFDADGSLFYVNPDGTTGTPAGDSSAWGSCADPISVDNLDDLKCEDEFPCGGVAPVETYEVGLRTPVIVDPAPWQIGGVGTYGATSTFSGTGAFEASQPESAVSRGWGIQLRTALECEDTAVPVAIRVDFTVTASQDDVNDDYGIGVIDVSTGLELPVASIGYGAQTFNNASAGHVWVGGQVAQDMTPGGPAGATPTPVTISAEWDLSAYTVADIRAGLFGLGAWMEAENGAPAVASDPVVTLVYTCPVEPMQVVPTNARLRKCDLDYLAAEIAAAIPTPPVQEEVCDTQIVGPVCYETTETVQFGLPAGATGGTASTVSGSLTVDIEDNGLAAANAAGGNALNQRVGTDGTPSTRRITFTSDCAIGFTVSGMQAKNAGGDERIQGLSPAPTSVDAHPNMVEIEPGAWTTLPGSAAADFVTFGYAAGSGPVTFEFQADSFPTALSTLSNVTATCVRQAIGVRDCATGITVWEDLATGVVVDPADIVACSTPTAAAEPATPEPVEACVATVAASVLDGGGVLTAGARYTLWVDVDDFALDGVPIPCGTLLNLPDQTGCTLAADMTVTTAGTVTVLTETVA